MSEPASRSTVDADPSEPGELRAVPLVDAAGETTSVRVLSPRLVQRWARRYPSAEITVLSGLDR